MNIRFFTKCLSSTLLILLASGVLLAQEGTGTIRGVVKDSVDAVWPGVLVTVSPIGRMADKRSVGKTLTDGHGVFVLANVAAGEYKVKAESYGYLYSNDSVNVPANGTVELDIELTLEGNCPGIIETDQDSLSDADKAEIANQILYLALVREQAPDHGLLTKQKGPMIVSTEAISAEWIKPLKNIDLSFMTKTEIQKRADTKGDFLYLSFHDWKVGTNCAMVTFTNSWAVGRTSGTGYLSGGGIVYLFRRENGKWIGHSVSGWIS